MKLTDVSFGNLPENFIWGAATSSYQIEGGERSGNRGRCIWDDLCDRPGAIKDGTHGGVGIDHINRVREDIQLISKINLDSYRFSFSWPRVIKGGTGDINAKGLDFYDRLVDGLLEQNIIPNATLYHWDLPSELQAKGGWTNPETVEHFGRYAHELASRFGDRIKMWATINEPWCVTYLGNLTGEHAPGIQDLSSTVRVAHQITRAHAVASNAIKAAAPDTLVGPVLNLANQIVIGEGDEQFNRELLLVDQMTNGWWLSGMLDGKYPKELVEHFAELTGIEIDDNEIPKTDNGRDWVGINYYAAQVFKPGGKGISVFPGTKVIDGAPWGTERTDMDWVWTPNGLGETLKMVHQRYPNMPLYVTENGACYNNDVDHDGRVKDSKREEYIARYLQSAINSIDDGVNLKGYYVWSLLDNFEWAWGFKMRFGIIHVNFDNFERTLKDSAFAYRDLIERFRNRNAKSA